MKVIIMNNNLMPKIMQIDKRLEEIKTSAAFISSRFLSISPLLQDKQPFD